MPAPTLRLPVTLLLLLLAACDTGGLEALRLDALSHDATALVGTWDLTSITSDGQYGPAVTTPVPAGTETYTFRADATVTVERRVGPPTTTTWAVVPAGPGYPGAPPSLRIGDRSEYWGPDGDRLYFDDRPADGALSEYRRR